MPLTLPTRFIDSLCVHAPSEADCWHSTEAEIFEADESLNTRQNLLTRRFVDARLEKAFVRRTFPLGRARVRAMFFFMLMYEVFDAARGASMSSTRGTPLPLIALFLAFTYSRRCTPRTLPYAIIFVTLAWALLILVPNSLAASELTQEIVVGVDGVVQTQIGVLEDFKRLLLQHTVAEFVSVVLLTLVCDAAGLSPPGMILLGVVCIGLHVFLYDAIFAARFSPELSVARSWWYPALSVIGIQIVQAYVVSALKRRLFLVQLLTAAHRIEQLSREKERAEWQQLLLAAARQRGATRSEPSDGEPVGTAQAAHEIAVGIDEIYSTVHAAAVESVAALPRILPGILSSSSGTSNKSDGEILAYLGKPTADSDDQSMDQSLSGASTAPSPPSRASRSSAAQSLAALRHEMLAERRELQARKAATLLFRSIAKTGVTTDASGQEPPSFASPPSVATSATAAELPHAFELEQQEPRGTIVETSRPVKAETSRPKKGHAHPLRAFVLALTYGRRPPGPMPGQMPAATVEAGDRPLAEP